MEGAAADRGLRDVAVLALDHGPGDHAALALVLLLEGHGLRPGYQFGGAAVVALFSGPAFVDTFWHWVLLWWRRFHINRRSQQRRRISSWSGDLFRRRSSALPHQLAIKSSMGFQLITVSDPLDRSGAEVRHKLSVLAYRLQADTDVVLARAVVPHELHQPAKVARQSGGGLNCPPVLFGDLNCHWVLSFSRFCACRQTGR